MRCAVSCRSLLAERTHHINSWFPGLAGLFPLAMVLRRRDQTDDVTSGLDRSHLQRRRARSPSQAERRRTSACLCAACPEAHGIRCARRRRHACRGRSPRRSGADKGWQRQSAPSRAAVWTLAVGRRTCATELTARPDRTSRRGAQISIVGERRMRGARVKFTCTHRFDGDVS